MSILVAVANYPNTKGDKALMYVHVRNMCYVRKGLDVTVLNFSAKHGYEINGIRVISLAAYKMEKQQYDLLILHAANIRQHYLFCLQYQHRFKRLIFFFHGHEVLRIKEVYPKPYVFLPRNRIKDIIQNPYDSIKLFLWRRYLPKLASKAEFVFVSKWLKEKALCYLRLSDEKLMLHVHIIHNSVGNVFETQSYTWETPKKYDFIAIRSNMDKPNYCVDLFNEIAKRNKRYSFLVIGNGKLFTYSPKAENLTWVSGMLSHEAMLRYLDESRCALMLTKQDTQGVMTCEMATYGMPVISSDIPVCHEVLDDFPNVRLINNEKTDIDLQRILDTLTEGEPYAKNDKYFSCNTSKKEVQLIKHVLKR